MKQTKTIIEPKIQYQVNSICENGKEIQLVKNYLYLGVKFNNPLAFEYKIEAYHERLEKLRDLISSASIYKKV
eukprot:snap_masked-scaffold_3-processed-gene-14.34-mRNA-1 protein AED:1.00 eAED:1.00 QI:0/0/0/0/1/1/2/0/72